MRAEKEIERVIICHSSWMVLVGNYGGSFHDRAGSSYYHRGTRHLVSSGWFFELVLFSADGAGDCRLDDAIWSSGSRMSL